MPHLLKLWSIWFVFICFISLPWVGFTTQPQWDRVHWLPFTDPADRPRDFVLNALVFLPFGFLVAHRRHASSSLLLSAVMAATISVAAEATQLFSTRRFPSATDVTAAVTGALAGALSTLSIANSSKPDTWTD
jgi:glycopeptide antibiotics resistance protein